MVLWMILTLILARRTTGMFYFSAFAREHKIQEPAQQGTNQPGYDHGQVIMYAHAAEVSADGDNG